MAESSLQDRLRGHAKAFDGLLSLIPAKMYYGEDNTDQWKKKKQTKQEAAAARRGKLDPDSDLNRNAKEVMEERAKNKRKLRDMEQEELGDNNGEGDESFEAIEGIDTELPGEGLKKHTEEEPNNKKQKVDTSVDEEEKNTEPSQQSASLSKKEQKRAEKKERKAEKKVSKNVDEEQTVTQTKPATQNDDAQAVKNEKKAKSLKPAKKEEKQHKSKSKSKEKSENADESSTTPVGRDQTQDVELSLDFSGLQDEGQEEDSSVWESEPPSPTFDNNAPSNGAKATSTEPTSTTTSVSSTVEPSEKPKHVKIPADSPELRARLAAKIEALRAARKADGPDGKPIRTRQELIESRRQKQAQRKAHKQELRIQAREEEQRKREEALASNSPSVMSPAVELDESNGNFAFGRVAFGDGAQLSHDLSYVLNRGKKKGPSDAKTALLKVQNQKKHLEEMDEEKRKDVAEKDAWLHARRRAEGEKIRDDEAMLKRTVKRKDAAKKKSEKQWKERVRGVDQAQHERVKKREENLKKRRDEKLLGKAGRKKKSGAGGGAKKKGRPGFEGSLGLGRKK